MSVCTRMSYDTSRIGWVRQIKGEEEGVRKESYVYVMERICTAAWLP